MKKRVLTLVLGLALCFGLVCSASAIKVEINPGVDIHPVTPTNPTPDTPTPGTPTPAEPSGGEGFFVPPAATQPAEPSAQPSAPSEPTGEDASATVTPSVKDSAASAELNQKQADQLVNEAVQNESANVNVTVDAPAEATSVSATIPASSAGTLAEKTDANLTVSTPLADVVLSNATVEDLAAKADSSVTVAVDQRGESTTVSIQVDGNDAGTVSGVTAKLPVENAASGTVVKVVNPDGSEKILKKAVAKDGSVSIPLTGTTTVKITDNSKSFTDTANHWATASIDFVASRELFQGTGDGSTFSPTGKMSRGMLATVLYRLEDEPGTSLDSLFPDVSKDSWYTEGVSWASSKHIITGQDDGMFVPERDITREELAVMLYRYADSLGMDTYSGNDASRFSDGGSVSAWAMDAMNWAVNKGIISGNNAGLLNPHDTASRAEVSTMIERLIKLM